MALLVLDSLESVQERHTYWRRDNTKIGAERNGLCVVLDWDGRGLTWSGYYLTFKCSWFLLRLLFLRQHPTRRGDLERTNAATVYTCFGT